MSKTPLADPSSLNYAHHATSGAATFRAVRIATIVWSAEVVAQSLSYLIGPDLATHRWLDLPDPALSVFVGGCAAVMLWIAVAWRDCVHIPVMLPLSAGTTSGVTLLFAAWRIFRYPPVTLDRFFVETSDWVLVLIATLAWPILVVVVSARRVPEPRKSARWLMTGSLIAVAAGIATLAGFMMHGDLRMGWLYSTGMPMLPGLVALLLAAAAVGAGMRVPGRRTVLAVAIVMSLVWLASCFIYCVNAMTVNPLPQSLLLLVDRIHGEAAYLRVLQRLSLVFVRWQIAPFMLMLWMLSQRRNDHADAH